MASGLGVRAVRSLGQAGGISSGRRLCPACLVFRDIQARQYNHGPSSRQARSSEFAPTPLKPTKSAVSPMNLFTWFKPIPPTHASLYNQPKVKVADSLLRAQFQTIFHNPTKSIDSHQALHAAYPSSFAEISVLFSIRIPRRYRSLSLPYYNKPIRQTKKDGKRWYF